eukprot:tig00000767_g3960.t1
MKGVQVREALLLEDEESIIAVHCAHAPHTMSLVLDDQHGHSHAHGGEKASTRVHSRLHKFKYDMLISDWKPKKARRQHASVATWQPPRAASGSKSARTADALHSVHSGKATEQRMHEEKEHFRSQVRMYPAGPSPMGDDEPYEPSAVKDDEELATGDLDGHRHAQQGRRGLRFDLFGWLGNGIKKAASAIKKGSDRRSRRVSRKPATG